MTGKLIKLLSLAALAVTPLTSHALDTPQNTLDLATSLCLHPDETPLQLSGHEYTENEIIIRGSRLGIEKLFTSKSGTLKLDIIEPAGRPKRTALSVSDGNDINKPGIWMILDAECKLQEAKQAVFDDADNLLYIETLDQSLTAIADKEWLNPPLPDNSGKSDGVRVALIDSGVNYQLDEIAQSLALNTDGVFIGYDYWDNDNKPFDANPARSWFFVQRHGTRTASILLREAPDIALVPYRYPRPDMSRMTQLIEHAAVNSIRIIGVPLGSNDHKEWAAFSRAVEQYPEILFIVSAGNNGRNIDLNPVYPAAFDHSNIIVVTSSDDTIRPAERTNYGSLSVDYLLPAENIPALDFNGERTPVSGSSYAVSRLAALAARLLTEQPDMSIVKLRKKISDFSIRANTASYVSVGYIGDPMADTASLSSYKDPDFKPIEQASRFNLPINLVALTDDWTTDKITQSLNQANAVFNQCGLAISAQELIRVNGSNYISNLSPGSALTLGRYLNDQLAGNPTTIYFAADTDMQTKFDAEAFGKGNTGTRPWMRDSLWVTSVTPDSGNAVAHELIHIMSNNGQHSREENNLMQDRTSPDNTRLLPAQCQQAIATASENGLIN